MTVRGRNPHSNSSTPAPTLPAGNLEGYYSNDSEAKVVAHSESE